MTDNASGVNERYRESRIQDGFVSWFSRSTGYVQRYEDAHTQQNTPMDSLGFVGAAPVLIEVKASVSIGMLQSDAGRASALEHKILWAVRGLYQGRPGAIAGALGEWDRRTPPEFIFVAGAYSAEALAELKRLLARRGSDCRFGARIYRWDGAEAACLFTLPAPEAVDPAQVKIPDLKPMPAGRRAPKLALQELRGVLTAQGLQECLDAMLAEMARRCVAIRGRNVRNANYGKTTLDGSRMVTLIGIWPYDSTPGEGLLVSVDLQAFPQCFPVPALSDADVPGTPAPVVGFLNCQRYLCSPAEVQAFWAALAPVDRAGDN